MALRAPGTANETGEDIKGLLVRICERAPRILEARRDPGGAEGRMGCGDSDKEQRTWRHRPARFHNYGSCDLVRKYKLENPKKSGLHRSLGELSNAVIEKSILIIFWWVTMCRKLC